MEKLKFLKHKRGASKNNLYTDISHNDFLFNNVKFRKLFDNHPDIIFTLDVNGKVLNVNNSVKKIIGDITKDRIKRAEYLAKDYRHKRKKYFQQTLTGVAQNYKAAAYDKNGQIIDLDITYVPIFNTDMQVVGVYGNAKDVTIKHDYLTGLPNRRMFERKIDALIQSSKEWEKVFSVLYLDLDRFKIINDTLGNGIANKLLQQVSLRIKRLLHEPFLFARLDGDKFGIVLSDYQQSDLPETMAKAIIDSMKEPLFIDNYELYITTSIGITTFSNGDNPDELLKHVNAALKRAKEMGKNNYQIYSSSLKIESFKRYNLEKDLHKALEQNQLLLHFQPRVEASTGTIKSAEALIRWQHPVWGLVSPKEFIPIAEENGFIIEIGDWVFKQVCHYIKEWKQNQLKVVPISINISAQRFLKSDWIKIVNDTLKETGTDPKLIEIEITETTLIQHEKEVSLAIRCLKELGIKVALDDFGTGYSSLSYLTRYPLDTIKIDQSFISNITKNNSDEVIVKATILMAKGLEKNVVAEGVETVEQLSFLKQHGCSEIQGYLFSKPVPEKQFQSLLTKSLLHPIYNSHNPVEIMNRRKYYRIKLTFPLSSKITIISINRKMIELGKTEALIEDIGPGGNSFLSVIDLPVRPDITFQLETKIMNQNITLNGMIVWKQEVDGIFQYGLKYLIDENDRGNLVKLLNNFSVQMRNNSLVPNCSFVTNEKINYLKKMYSN